MIKKKILFLTGTRADFGKMKSLIDAVENSEKFEPYLFVTGMHLLPKYGVTAHEILKCGYVNTYLYNNESFQRGMDISLANTISGITLYIKDLKPDLIIVHGDRPEALAGAIVGAFNNIRVAHIEGGELSGTIDGMIRHAVTKLSHIHFVTNEKSRKRVEQMGEANDSIFVIGSPEIDLMLSDKLPDVEETKSRYNIKFGNYSILAYHPVTSEIDILADNIKQVVDAVIKSKLNYIVIRPNNDMGTTVIMDEYKRFKDNDKIRIFPSVRFECFLSLLKNSDFIIGNSSSGVREAPVFGVPSINIGTRQKDRNHGSLSIFNVAENTREILKAINRIKKEGWSTEKENKFGEGKSASRFIDALQSDIFWKVPLQKQFKDL